jgi:hypothetical protein
MLLTIITIILLFATTSVVDSFKPWNNKCNNKIPKIMHQVKTRVTAITMFNDPNDAMFQSFNNKQTDTQLQFSSKPLAGEDAAVFSFEQQKVSSWLTFSAGK